MCEIIFKEALLVKKFIIHNFLDLIGPIAVFCVLACFGAYIIMENKKAGKFGFSPTSPRQVIRPVGELPESEEVNPVVQKALRRLQEKKK